MQFECSDLGVPDQLPEVQAEIQLVMPGSAICSLVASRPCSTIRIIIITLVRPTLEYANITLFPFRGATLLAASLLPHCLIMAHLDDPELISG
ncbi:hypothetical protein MRX96_059654 [Rhipicephalus microplus]